MQAPSTTPEFSPEQSSLLAKVTWLAVQAAPAGARALHTEQAYAGARVQDRTEHRRAAPPPSSSSHHQVALPRPAEAAAHPPRLNVPTLPRSSPLQHPLRGEGEGRGALAAARRLVRRAQGSRALTTRERRGEREKGGASARAPSEPPYPLGGEASRPGPERRGGEHGGPNCQSFPQLRGPESPGRTACVRAPASGPERPARRAAPYAGAAGARGGARGLLGPRGRGLRGAGREPASALKGRVWPAALGSQP